MRNKLNTIILNTLADLELIHIWYFSCVISLILNVYIFINDKGASISSLVIFFFFVAGVLFFCLYFIYVVCCLLYIFLTKDKDFVDFRRKLFIGFIKDKEDKK